MALFEAEAKKQLLEMITPVLGPEFILVKVIKGRDQIFYIKQTLSIA